MFELKNAFPGQEKNEAIFVFGRPFFLAFVPTSLVFLVIFLTQVAFQIAANSNSLGFTPFGNTVLILLLGVTELFTIVVYTVALFDFYFDILIVTDKKIVDIDQEQLFFRNIAELNLVDVEDTKSTTKGFFQTFFDYGTVTIQTAGTQNNFVISNFRRPRQIASIISDLAEQAKSSVPDHERKPEGDTLAVIDGEKITTMQELVAAEAVLTNDSRVSGSHHKKP